MGNAQEGKGGAVPDGSHPGDGPLSLQECHRLGPSAQLGPLHGPGLSAKRTPDGDEALPGRAETVAGEATSKTNEDGRTLRGSTESRTESETAGGETKRLDIGGDVEAH